MGVSGMFICASPMDCQYPLPEPASAILSVDCQLTGLIILGGVERPVVRVLLSRPRRKFLPCCFTRARQADSRELPIRRSRPCRDPSTSYGPRFVRAILRSG